MTNRLFDRILVPVVDEDDAEATVRALLPHLEREGVDEVTVVNVIEKAGGAPDKAPPGRLEEMAEDAFEVFERRCADAGVSIETRLTYHTSITEGIGVVADDVDATAVVFTPRGGSRWIDLLAGDVRNELVTEANRPVVVLPDTEPE